MIFWKWLKALKNHIFRQQMSFLAFLASFKISFSSLYNPSDNPFQKVKKERSDLNLFKNYQIASLYFCEVFIEKS